MQARRAGSRVRGTGSRGEGLRRACRRALVVVAGTQTMASHLCDTGPAVPAVQQGMGTTP